MRAVIYARYSSTQQREESIEAQVRACSGYIDKQSGWTLIGQYADRAFSARSDQRPEFQRMIRDAKQRKFDVLVIHKLDRFSRDRYDHAFYKRELRQAGVRLVSVLENLDDSPESVVLESVLEGFSEYYSRNLGREVMKGLRETALACKHTGGIPPLGYDVNNDGEYVVNEREAAVVRYIYEAYIDGAGYSRIVDHVRDMGIRGKRGRPIGKNSLHSVLNNEKYTGIFVFNRSAPKDVYGKRNGHAYKPDDEIIKIDGGIPAIISRETWKKAQTKMRANKSGTHRAREPYLLSGILFCGKCKGPMTGNSRGNPRSATEIPKHYYECSTRKRTRQCDAPGVERDLIENVIMSYLETLLDREAIDKIAVWVTENAKLYRKKALSETQSLKKELATVTAEANVLLDKIMSGLDSKLARQRLADVEARKLHLEIKLSDMQIAAESAAGATRYEVRRYLSRLKGIRSYGRKEQTKIIKQFVRRIDIISPAGGDDGGKKRLKIRSKLDDLLINARIETMSVLLRHNERG